MLVLIAVALMPLCLILCHSLWLEPHHPTDEEDNIVRIRIGSGEPLESSEPVSSDARFASRLVMDAGGVREVDFSSVSQDGYRVFDLPLAASGGAVFAVTTHARTISLEPAKFEHYLREEGLARPDDPPPAGPITEEYSKFAKALFRGRPGSNATWTKELGLTLEIVPLGDELRLNALAQFQVLHEAQPVEGFGLWYVRNSGVKTLYRTDSQGRVALTLDTPGLAVLKGIEMRTVDQPDLQRRSWWGSLCFEVRS